MKMWIFLTWLLLITWTPSYAAKEVDTEDMELLIDLLMFYSKMSPSPAVTGFLCWDASQITKFMRRLSEQDITSTFHNTENIQLKFYENVRERKITFILDMSCAGATDVLQKAKNAQLFNDWFKWILLEIDCSPNNLNFNNDNNEFDYYRNTSLGTYSPYLTVDTCIETNSISTLSQEVLMCKQTRSKVEKIGIMVNNDVTVVKRVSEGKYTLTEVYKLPEILVENKIGEWTAACRLQHTNIYMSTRRMNLQQTTLKTAMVITNNFTKEHLDDTVEKQIDTITRLDYALFRHMLQFLNASMKLTVENSWGYESENGSWNGMCGHLHRGEADIGITGMFATKNRLPFVSYISSTSVTRAAFIFRQPPLSFVENIFTLPFSRSVWMASFGLIGFVGILLYYALKWEYSLEVLPDSQNKTSWSDILLLAIGAICQQSTLTEAQRIPGRIITIVLFVAVIFLYTSYSACIVALLQSTTTSIRTLKDLLNSGLTLAAEDIVYNRHYFSIAADPVRKAIYMQKISPPGGPERFLKREEGLEHLRKGFFAFHLELGSGYKFIADTFLEEEKCNLQTISYLYEIKDPWIAVSKNTPYKELFSIGYRKIQERGLKTRENWRYYQKKPECAGRATSFVSVGIVDCYPALLVLVYGILIAVASLLLEILAHKKYIQCHSVKSCIKHSAIQVGDSNHIA